MESYHGSHISEEMLERYSLNQLMEEQLAPLEEHLLLCPTCQDCLDAMDEYVHTMKFSLASAANEVSVKNSPRRLAFRQPRLALAWAGALAVLVLVIAVPTRRSNNIQSDITLSAARGGDLLPIGRAGANLVLHIDLREIAKAGTYGLELVNAAGQSVWRGSAQPNQDQIVVGVPTRLGAGRYWLRLFDSAQPPALVREYGLELK